MASRIYILPARTYLQSLSSLFFIVSFYNTSSSRSHSNTKMGGVAFQGTADTGRIEAPVTWKSYMMCAFAAFGGIFFGFDSGYISGVLAMDYFIHLFTGLSIPGPDASKAVQNAFVIPTPHKSLIVSVLSAGTFFGAILAGDLADWFGRRTTVILGCAVYGIGCILQTASSGLGLLVAGRLIAGFGVGFVSAIIILYMSEIAPKGVRGAIVSGKNHTSLLVPSKRF
jgi:MFS family permease